MRYWKTIEGDLQLPNLSTTHIRPNIYLKSNDIPSYIYNEMNYETNINEEIKVSYGNLVIEISAKEYYLHQRIAILTKNNYSLGSYSALINLKATERLAFTLLADKRNLSHDEATLFELGFMEDEQTYLMTADDTKYQLFLQLHESMITFLEDEPNSNLVAKKALKIILESIDLISNELHRVNGMVEV